jgi:hypothetical protein
VLDAKRRQLDVANLHLALALPDVGVIQAE